jgi:H+-transporting ATPase
MLYPSVEKEPNVEKEPGPPGETSSDIPSSSIPKGKKREYKDFGHDTEQPTRLSLYFADLFYLIHALRTDANVDMSQVCMRTVFLSEFLPISDAMSARSD